MAKLDTLVTTHMTERLFQPERLAIILSEDGMTEMDDALKHRLNILKADRDRAKAALERAKSHSSEAIQIHPALLEQFGRTMRGNFTSGSIPLRPAYLQSLIDVIEVDDAQSTSREAKMYSKRRFWPAGMGHPGFAVESEWRARKDSAGFVVWGPACCCPTRRGRNGQSTSA